MPTEILLVTPLLLPLLGAALLLAIRPRPVIQRWVTVAICAALIPVSLSLLASAVTTGPVAVSIGNFPFPAGIVLVVDGLAGIMLLISSIIATGCVIFATASIDEGKERFGFWPLVLGLMLGVNGAFLTADIFNLFVWFEVMLMASFVLMVLGGERDQLEGGMTYVTINLISSAMFLSAVGITWGLIGTLNMADIAVRFREGLVAPPLVAAVATLYLLAFGIKAALVPFFFWLPASYHTPPVVVTALFGALLTKVGVYAIFRTMGMVFPPDPGWIQPLLLVLSLATMVIGVMGAIGQTDFRRVLSFHIVSQIGYLTLGVALLSPLALAASIFYMVHNILAKTNLFLIGGVVERYAGTLSLYRLGGMSVLTPWLAAVFLVSGLSLAGIPPFSGFFAKLFVAQGAASLENWAALGISIAVGFFTLYSMMKLWNEAFWKNRPDDAPPLADPGRPALLALATPAVSFAVLIVAMGLLAGPGFEIASTAAGQLADPTAYIQAVRSAGP